MNDITYNNFILDELKQKRQITMNKIKEYQGKLFELQNELMNIEQKIVDMDYKDIMNSLTLNEQQLNIINSTEQNTLVIAAPGSGKTHTLISMYIKLIVEDNYDPNQIILITFTKKAGQEMLGRLSSLIPTKLPKYIGSLHGFCFKILQDIKNINYTILDEKESRDLIKNTIDNINNIDDNIISIIKSKISIIIDQASSTYPFNLSYSLKKNNLELYEKEINIIINEYNKRKKHENLLDFNDLMILFCQFLDSIESIDFINNIKYIFFDEYQDVNSIQNYILNKFKNKSKIMVVGDDAQAIYSFRGSSVNFILEFPNNFKPNKLFLLENNYRSTNEIVTFFQDIITKNTNQYNKNVNAILKNKGIKPIIIGFETNKQKDQWIINDIFKNNKNGIPFSKMVIIARKNDSLDKIELELVKQGLTVIKHTGLSILDRPHVKDFLAFITIIINEKSTLHWKRVLSLHNNIGVNIANDIIENSNNIRETIKKLKETKINYAIQLKELDFLITQLTNPLIKIKDIDCARHILSYLEKIWTNKSKQDCHLQEKIKDILLLIGFINQSNLKDFINDLYLNQSIETNMENTIYLTTIHGSKGLEWDYVYLIDVDSESFPSVKKNYYLLEGVDMEEERRLFYVACSRAKSNLVITYTFNNNSKNLISMSPFIQEINKNYYTGINMNYLNYKMSGIVSYDVNNYLKFMGYSNIYPIIKELETSRYHLHKMYDIFGYDKLSWDKLKNGRLVIGNFFDYLLAKIVQINFNNIISKFELNTITKFENFPQKIKQNYMDELTDWRNLLNDIFYVSTFNIQDTDYIFEKLKTMLINDEIYQHYNLINNKLTEFIKKMNPKNILSHYNVSFGNVRAEIDLLIDDTIIEIKTNYNEIATLSNITQTLIYAYLLLKKNKPINRIILYNPITGEINDFNVKNFNFKLIANIVYSLFKQ